MNRIYGFTWEDSRLLRRMACILDHRGFDAKKYFIDRDVSLGNNMLQIESKTKSFPGLNEDGSIYAMLDGRKDNFEELKKDLERQKHSFSSYNEAEALAHAYEE